MTCENCSSNNLLYLSDSEIICKSCGFVKDDMQEQIDFIDNKIHNRCCEYESKMNLRIRDYMEKLNCNWTSFHMENVQTYIEEQLAKKFPVCEKSIIIASVLKYATLHSIPCDIHVHKEIMGLSTKGLSKSLRYIHAGVISEGICDKNIQNFIKNYGDTGNVRPNSLVGKGHDVTKLLGSHIQSNVMESRKYNRNGRLIDDLLDIFMTNEEKKNEITVSVHKLYDDLEKTSIIDEGETIISLMAVYVILNKNGTIDKPKDFCMKTRLTSLPTFNKILRKYF